MTDKAEAGGVWRKTVLAARGSIAIMARRIFGHWHCGFGPIDWRGMWWMALRRWGRSPDAVIPA